MRHRLNPTSRRRYLLLVRFLVAAGAIALATTLVHVPSGHGTSGIAANAQPAGLPSGRPAARAAPRAHALAAGTDAWRLTMPAMDHQIEGYATRADVEPGEPASLRVSTSAATFRVTAYRFGWYRGGEARLVWRSRWVKGERQAPATFSDHTTRTIVAPWHDSMVVSTAGWEPGVYVLDLVASTGWESQIPLIVRSVTTAGTVALVAPVATWQAYNRWGGYSLYTGLLGDRRSYAVSFDRPYPDPGAGEMMYGVVPVVVRAERLGIPLAYLSDLDLEADPGVLDGARAVVSMGHDEYWTPRMRQSVMDARDHGTNVAILGADTEFWRIGVASTPTGPGRLVVGYRWAYRYAPQWVSGSATDTGPFGSPPGLTPEEALTGMRYECFPVDADYTIVSPGWWGFAGTGVRAGTAFPHLVGVEADRVYPTAATPRPLQILSFTTYRCGGVSTSTQSVYFTTGSGAGVFNAGTLQWTCALQHGCLPRNVSWATTRFTRQVTDNVLRAFARGPAGRIHPAHDTLGRYSLPLTHTVPAE